MAGMGASGHRQPTRDLCPACGEKKLMLLVKGWDERGNCAECRACGHRVTNPEWRAIRAERFATAGR